MKSPIRTLLQQLGVLTPALFCTACASISGAWYYQTGEKDDGNNLYLAIVNDTGKTRELIALEVNTPKRGCALSWKCEPRNNNQGALPLLPGQLLIVALPTDGAFQCTLPTHGRAVFAEGRDIELELPRSMPSALPDAWQRECMQENEPPGTRDDTNGKTALVCRQRAENCSAAGAAPSATTSPTP